MEERARHPLRKEARANRARLLRCGVLFLLLTVPPLTGALSPILPRQNDERRAQIRVAVNLVRVDVNVFDRSGAFAAGLRPEDFRVYEDGVPQRIQNFELVDSERATPGTEPAPEGTPPARGMPSILMFVIDNLNSRWENLSQMTAAVEGFVTDSLRPQDLVGIVSVSHSPRLVQNFTHNRPAILASARAVLSRSLQADSSRSHADFAVKEARIEQDTAEYTTDPVVQAEAELARQEAARLVSLQNDYSARNALFTLMSVCESLAKLHGRKTVIFVSEGVSPTNAVDFLLESIVNAAHRANVSIYTMDPNGLEFRDAALTVELATRPRGRTFASTGNAIGGNSDFDLVRLEGKLNARDDGLALLSNATGGVAFRRSNAYRTFLQQVARDSHSYYQLGYVPSNSSMDGKFRRIEVKLARDGYSVRARKGYYATDNAAGLVGTVEDQMKQALRTPMRIEQLSTSISPATFLDPTGATTAVVALNLAPGNTVLGAAAGGRGKAEYRLLAGAFDESGNLVQEYRRDYRLALEGHGLEQFRRVGASVSLALKLPPGKYQLKTVLRESETGRIGVQGQELEVRPYSPDGPTLSSLVLSESVAAHGEARARKGDYDPLTYGSSVVTPSATRTFDRAGVMQVYFHAYNVADAAVRTRSPYQYQVNLVRAGAPVAQSKLVPLDTSIAHPLGGFLLSSKVSLAFLDPGSYTLQVVLSLPDGRNRTARSIEFTVK